MYRVSARGLLSLGYASTLIMGTVFVFFLLAGIWRHGLTQSLGNLTIDVFSLVLLAVGFGAIVVGITYIWLKNRNSAKAKGEPESKRV